MPRSQSRRRWSVLGALVASVALVLAMPTTASAATPGVGDVSNAMRYDVSGPFGSPIAELSDEDDDSDTLTAPFALNFFGVVSNGICVTTNGGFFPVPTDTDGCSASYDEDVENLALDSGASMIAALAGDLDLGECADNSFDGFGIPCEIYFGTTTVDGRDAFIITWYRVPMNNDDNAETLSNTFQLVIVKKATGDDTVGWDFDIEFNYGTLTDGEDGYSAADPTDECDGEEGDADCRWGIGWANFIPGAPDTADSYELFASTPVFDLVDGGATPLVKNSLNSSVLGRYTFSMVGGVTQGFAVPVLAGTPKPALAATGSEAPNFVSIAGALSLLVAGMAIVATRRRRATS